MRKYLGIRNIVLVAACLTLIFAACAKMPSKQYYVLNYVPQPMQNRMMENPYACVIRLREFSIEEAYNRTQIVYRLSPYEIRYYNFRFWAVKPTRMITDLTFKHLNSANLVSSVVRRFDEGRKPDYELSGIIEALEEYDSDDIVFAHVAIRFHMTRLSDGQNLYSRYFDVRKRVARREADLVIREMSQIMEYILTQVTADVDAKLAAEFGVGTEPEALEFMAIDAPSFITIMPDDKGAQGFEDVSETEGTAGGGVE